MKKSSSRLALGLLLAINLFNYIDRQVLAAVEEPIRQTFHVTRSATGFLGTAFILSYMILSPIFGTLGDKVSRWLLIAIGVGLWSFASGATGLAATFTMLLLTRCCVGVGEAAYGPTAPALLSDLYPIESRGKIFALFYIAIPVGSALGYVLGGAANSLWSWRAGFYLVVPPGIILAALSLMMRDPRLAVANYDGEEKTRRDAVRPGSPVPTGLNENISSLSLLRNRSYIFDTLGMTAMTFAIGGVAFWMPSYVLERTNHQVSLGKINMIFGLLTVVAGLLATPLGGIAGDRLRPRIPGAYFFVSGVGLLIAFAAFLLLIVCPFPFAWVLIFIGEFALFFNTGPSNTILANVTSPAIRARAFAINIFIIHALGDAASPYLIGLVADHASMNLAFAMVSFLMLVGGVFWLMGAKYLAKDEALVGAA
jgi:MFS transporter, Spinster family, sphingosine-1-phosphate transporter